VSVRHAATWAVFKALNGESNPHGYTVTVAKRHAPYGFARHSGGGLLHKATKVVIVWDAGDVITVGARWRCNSNSSGTANAQLVNDPAGHAWCRRCEINREGSEMVVYVALCDEGGESLVKVGRTRNLDARMVSLKGELLGYADGSHPSSERAVLMALEPFRVRGREWFSKDCLPAAEEILGVPLARAGVS
jgi:hypothetical protein